jgi:hypothetical protein
MSKVMMHMGRIMDIDAGKTSRSSRSVSFVSIGTRIIPPLAPNNPFTMPAAAPAMAVYTDDLRKKSPPVEIVPQEALLIHD